MDLESKNDMHVGSWLVQWWVMVGGMLDHDWWNVGSWLVQWWVMVGATLACCWFVVGATLACGWHNVGV